VSIISSTAGAWFDTAHTYCQWYASAFANILVVFTEFEVGGERKEAGGQEEGDSRSVGSGVGPASGMFAFSNTVFILCIRFQCVEDKMQQHDTI